MVFCVDARYDWLLVFDLRLRDDMCSAGDCFVLRVMICCCGDVVVRLEFVC